MQKEKGEGEGTCQFMQESDYDDRSQKPQQVIRKIKT